MDNIEQLVKGLSEAQQNALLYLPHGYSDPNTVKALRRKGLYAGGCITPLGLRVRALLQEPKP